MRTRPSSSNPVPSPDSSAAGRSFSGRDGARHRPVLLQEVLHTLDVEEGDTLVDATLGGAGHAVELVKGLRGNGLFIGFDADSDALERARRALDSTRVGIHLVCADFRDIESEIRRLGVTQVTKVLFDLGWSSYQLDSGRGFSFKTDEPLLMTYRQPAQSGDRLGGDAGEAVTAHRVVNTWSEKSIADIIYGFGEERYARRIAKALVAERAKKPIETSRALAGIISKSVPAPYRRRKIHPATKTFQALRIAVNDELGALTHGLLGAWNLLAPEGRLAAITFHSVEDRIVKRTFAEWARSEEGELLMKKLITPTREEAQRNPRARSAKLRAIKKKNPHLKP